MSGTPLWELSGLDRSRFEAYTKLLRLRNGGQVEDAVDFSEMPDEEEEMSSAGLHRNESVDLAPLSHFDDKKLKRALLDRISELIANEKGGFYVSSSLMVEWPDRVDILVAKNNGFKEEDPSRSLLKTIESTLRDIAKSDHHDHIAIDARNNLWKSMLQSYTRRLVHYMDGLKQALKRTARPIVEDEIRVLHDREPPLTLHLEVLLVLINETLRSSARDRLEEVVRTAHDICSSYTEQDFKTLTSNKANFQSLRNALGFLGRLQTCFNTFVRAAERLSNFEFLRIIPSVDVSATGARSNKRTRARNWSAGETFRSLGLPLNDETANRVIGNGSMKQPVTKNKLLQKFEKLKSSSLEEHAEMQIVLAASRYEDTGASIFNYIGCSKRSCFLCFRFVQNYGPFETRGCHGKMYNLWTTPDPSWLTGERRAKLSRVLKQVEKDMKACILNKETHKIAHVSESTVGGSSIATMIPQVGHPFTASLVERHLRSQREEMTSFSGDDVDPRARRLDMTNEQGYEDSHDLPQPEFNQRQSPIPTPTTMYGECYICERKTSRRCAHCNLDFFCSQSCQDKMSLNHLTKCSARSITTADILCNDVYKDDIPRDEQVREHFGFSRCGHGREESHLLGLYQGLIMHLGVSSVELNEWRQKGILVSKIIEIFSTLPVKGRGGYYPWFLRNQNILDHSAASPAQLQKETNPLLRALEEARHCLDPEDRDRAIKDFEPPAKGYCFVFYAMALDSSCPNPNWAELDLWYDFGFAVCDDEYGERSLGSLYATLVGGNKFFRDYDESLGCTFRGMPELSTCSFDEFWRAWHKGNLAEVFEKYGLGLHGDSPREYYTRSFKTHSLREFLSFPMELRLLRPSVWRLKHLLALDVMTPLTDFPQIESAAREYGFAPRLDTRTRLGLRTFYQQFLREVDPLEVDKAKTRGELLTYAENTVRDIDSEVRDVLRNIDSQRKKVIASGGL